ncbi:metallophosphoesterase [Paenibacillus aquistagni]|nr:metallophosphoesterase [Paenibacillus aquistagni]
MIKRSYFRKLGAGMLALSLILSGCSKPEQRHYPAQGSVTAFVATDTHYLAPSLTDDGAAFRKYVDTGDSKQLERIKAIMQAFVHDIKAKKPDLLIVSGDISNNGEKQSHVEMAKLFQEIEDQGTQVYVIPGNHDILNPWSSQFQGDKQVKADPVTPDQFADIYGAFGYQEAIARDRKTLSYMAAPTKKLRLLMLDTNLYQSNERLRRPETGGIIPSSTQRWIRNVVKEAEQEGAQVLVVMHHNLLPHSELSEEGYQIKNSKEITELFQDLQLPLVISGHVHLQHIAALEDTSPTAHAESVEPLYDVATSALSVYPHQYGVLKYDSDAPSWDYSTAPVKVEEWASEAGVQDEDLLDFQNSARQFFNDFTRRLVKKELMNAHYSYDDIHVMTEFFVNVNNQYFAGKEIAHRDQLILSDAYHLWMSAEPSYLKGYIVSMLQPYKRSHDRLTLSLSHINTNAASQ